MKWVFMCACVYLSVCFGGRIAVPVNGVLVSLERVVDGRSHCGCHGVGVRSVRVLVRVQWRRVVQVHRLHRSRAAVRVPVHGARDPDAVHAVVGQVFILHTTHTFSDWAMCAQYSTLLNIINKHIWTWSENITHEKNILFFPSNVL